MNTLRYFKQKATKIKSLNTVRIAYKDKYIGVVLEINRKRYGVNNRTVGYRGPQAKPILEYFIQAANDWNPSNRIEISARTLKGLLSKIKKHKYKLVPY